MKELQQNRHVKILEKKEWSIPIRTVEVTYEPIRRSTMDVLMKMLLISMQEAEFRDAHELSELLLVDPLFIEDLVSLMSRVRLIEQVSRFYQLTPKGEQQLERGVFEEELDLQTASLLYSPCHHEFLPANVKSLEEYDELPDPYRYVDREAEQQEHFEETAIIVALQQEGEDEPVSLQTIIETITKVEAKQINDIPCLEFIIHNKEQDIIYVRVWNTLLNHWDEVLEQQLTTQEQLQWRNQYIK